MNRNRASIGIVSITPPNIQEHSFTHRPLNVKNKINLLTISQNEPNIHNESVKINPVSNLFKTIHPIVSSIENEKKKHNTTVKVDDVKYKNNQILSKSDSIYNNSTFNWVHYLILNYNECMKQNINTAQSAFEHWTQFGEKNNLKSIIQDDEMNEYLQLYIRLKENVKSNFIDRKFEHKIQIKKIGDKFPFHKYPTLFHKYLLNLRDPICSLIYNVTQIVKLKKKLICAIHCYNLNVFIEYFGDYVKNISDFFDIIVTYCLDNESVRHKYVFSFINMQNIGMDIGGKCVSIDYLKSINAKYDYIFFIHSKSDANRRNDYLKPFINNLASIQYYLKNDKTLGAIFPNTFAIGRHGLNLISNKLNSIIKKSKYEEINWDVNESTINEMYSYFGVKDETFIFPEGNYYILHNSIANALFGDKYIYNALNTVNSFDYNWIRHYYKLNDDYSSAYVKYKSEKWFGNHIETNLGHRGLADAMIEHTFERTVIPMTLKLKKTIKILNSNKINAKMEAYLNDFKIKKNKQNDFTYIKEYITHMDNDFDWEIYLLLNPDLENKGVLTKRDAIKHWYTSGKQEGRSYCDFDFDWEIYLLLYDDLERAGIKTKLQAYTHWIKAGKMEKRSTRDPEFDWEQYLLLYPDLVLNGINSYNAAYKHWIISGKKEGRICNVNWDEISDFDWMYYGLMNKDLKLNGIATKEQLYSHWLAHGKKEERVSCPKIHEKLYNSVVNYKSKLNNTLGNLKFKKIDKIKNENYIILQKYKETIKHGDPYFKNMNMITPDSINDYQSFILIVDFNYGGGGATHFLNCILDLYKSKQTFLITRSFNGFIYFYINDEIMIHHKYTIDEAIASIKNKKTNIKKIFINSILNHDKKFLDELFLLDKNIAAITHDYSLIFNKWSGYYHEFENKEIASLIDINNLNKLITQNENNLVLYKRAIKDNTLPIIVSDLPDHKYSLNKIDTENKKTVVGILGNITDIKGFYLVYKLIDAFKNDEDIKIVVFGNINMEFENMYKYSNIDELNELLIKYKPNIWIETSICPETYSYTATIMMLTQLPILYQKKPFPSVIENRMKTYKKKYEFENINIILNNKNLITNRKQNYFYTVDNRIYSNSFWDSYFIYKEPKKIISPSPKSHGIIHNITPYCVYFPQFHSFPENDKNFYEGFTDIKNLEYVKDNLTDISVITPSLKELELNTISDYDLVENKNIIQKQIDLLEKYNISGFAMYYYWFSTNTITKQNMIMEKVIDRFFSDDIDIKGRKVFFIWANEDWTTNAAFGKTTDRIENYYDLYNINKNIENLIKYFNHPNYLKIDKKPVFFLHHPWFLSKSEIDLFNKNLREICIKNGFDGVYFILNSMSKTYDGHKHYDFHFNYKTDKSGSVSIDNSGNRVLDYEKYIDSVNYSNKNIKTLVFDFDNRVRLAKPDKLSMSTVCKNNTPENQEKFISKTIESYKNSTDQIGKILLINAWNEWGEKMVIEPSLEMGNYYLNIIKRKLNETMFIL